MSDDVLHEPEDTEGDHATFVPEDDASADDGAEVVPNFGRIYVELAHPDGGE